MPGGRPTKYNAEIAAEITSRMSEGETLKAICEDDRMPHASSIYLWLSKHPEFSELYTRAQSDRANRLADEILEIADDGRNDWMERNGEDNVGWIANGEALQRSRLRVDTRKWLASKMLPKQYGDKIQGAADDGSHVVKLEIVRKIIE